MLGEVLEDLARVCHGRKQRDFAQSGLLGAAQHVLELADAALDAALLLTGGVDRGDDLLPNL